MLNNHTAEVMSAFESDALCCKSIKQTNTRAKIKRTSILPKARIKTLWKRFRNFTWSFIHLSKLSDQAATKYSAPQDAHALDKLSYNPLKDKRRVIYTFLPNSKYKEMFEFIRSIILIIDYIITFYVYFFETQEYLALDILIIPWSIDIIFRCFIGYYDDIKLVLQFKKTCLRYIMGSFVIDILSTIPFYHIIGPFFLCFKFIRIYRIGECSKIIEYTLIPICHFLNMSLAGIKTVERLLLLVFYIALFSHMVSCYWVYLGRFPGGWVEIEEADGLVESRSDSNMYIASYYFVMTTLTSVGYGDISGTTSPEMIVMMVLEIIGCWCYCALLWDINEILIVYSSSSKTSLEDELGIWLMRMDHTKPIRLKPEYFIHIIEFYHQFWLQNLSSLKANEFFDKLTPQLQRQLVDYLSEKPVFERFKHFFEGTEEGFRRDVAMDMEYCEFKTLSRIDRRNEPIVKKGGKFNRIFFIIKGEVKVSSAGMMHELFKLGPGSFFGESNVIFNYPSSYFYKKNQNENVKTFSIKKHLFLKSCKMYPKSFEVLKARALKRREMFRLEKRKHINNESNQAQKAIYIGKLYAKAAILGAFGGHPEQLNSIKETKEDKSVSSIITFSSNEEDYFPDEEEKNVERLPSEADGIGNNNKESKSKELDDFNIDQKNNSYDENPTERNLVTRVTMDTKRENEEKGKSKSLALPKYSEPRVGPKGARAKTTMFTHKMPSYMNIMRTQVLMQNLMGQTRKEVTIISSSPNTLSKKESTMEFSTFIHKNKKINKFGIMGAELFYNSEEEFGADDAIMQEHLHGTLLNRVEGIEDGVIKALQKFESEIIRIKRRLKKVVHIVNIILA